MNEIESSRPQFNFKEKVARVRELVSMEMYTLNELDTEAIEDLLADYDILLHVFDTMNASIKNRLKARMSRDEVIEWIMSNT